MVEQGLWSKTTYSGLMDKLHTNAQSSATNRVEKSSLTTASWLRWLSSRVLRGLGTNTDKLHRKASGDYSEVADTNENMDSDAEREAEFLELWDSWALYSATWLAKVGDVARRFAKFWVGLWFTLNGYIACLRVSKRMTCWKSGRGMREEDFHSQIQTMELMHFRRKIMHQVSYSHLQAISLNVFN
jgi:hypothetical protein